MNCYPQYHCRYLWGPYDSAEPQELLKTLEQNETAVMTGPYLIAANDTNTVKYAVSEAWMPKQYSAPRVAVWCDVNGQDDLVWYNLERNEAQQYEAAVSVYSQRISPRPDLF